MTTDTLISRLVARERIGYALIAASPCGANEIDALATKRINVSKMRRAILSGGCTCGATARACLVCQAWDTIFRENAEQRLIFAEVKS